MSFKKDISDLGFEDLTAVVMKSSIFYTALQAYPRR
jgi:hypothetical protein